MRTSLVGIPLLFLVQGLALTSPGTDVVVTRRPDGIVVRNSVMTREITFTDSKPSAVLPASFRVNGKGELIAGGGTESDWFELPVGERPVTNRDACWEFDGYSTQSLGNGGTEVRLRFRGVTPPAASLQWEFLLQVFPRSTLCREKVVFRTRPGTVARLNGASGHPFIFPCYTFQRENGAACTTRTVSLASWGQDLVAEAPGNSFDDRTLEAGARIGRNLAQNYMYHPVQTDAALRVEEDTASPGPICLARGLTGDTGLLIAYEHGAPDNDTEQEYIVIRRKLIPAALEVSTVYSRGAFLHNQAISNREPFESVWTALGTFDGAGFAGGTVLVHGYLHSQITESVPSRKPLFYYNTWGMQRDEEQQGADIRKVLTTERVLREIDLARKLDVDVFVLDDGWQDRFGDWHPDPLRYPDGLRWYVKALQARGMIPGLWLAALATDPEAEITRAHPEWLVRDEQGHPVIGRWNKNIFCFDSDYRDYFIGKCKDLIDQGIRYFKWDGIDKHLCPSADHHHGTAGNSPEERRQRQGYDLPLLVADAIRQPREYQPEVVVEVDVTEPHRSVGLAILSQGKYFWMNNGASWYGDYSTHRAKSTRFVTNLYHTILPLPLQTFANYPHNNTTYSSRRHNVNSSLIGGWGFWGNLTRIDTVDLERAGRLVALSKKVLRDVAALQPRVTGAVGASPEIYELVDRPKAVGQIIAFSGGAISTVYAVPGLSASNLLAVVRNAYAARNDSLFLPLVFPMPEASREAFVLPNNGSGISVISSTSWLEDAFLAGTDTLVIVPGAAGIHSLDWDPRHGSPEVTPRSLLRHMEPPQAAGNPYRITIASTVPFARIMITGRK